jgi:hypothetical protein
MHIGSLTSAAHTSLHALGEIYRGVEEVAHAVATPVQAEPGRGSLISQFEQLARLVELRQHARANMRVFSSAEELMSELAWLPRK